MPASTILRNVRGALDPSNVTRLFRNESLLRPILLLTCVAVISSYMFTGLGTAIGRDTNPHRLRALALVAKDLNAVRIHERNTRCVLKKNTIVEMVAQSGNDLVCMLMNSPEAGVTLALPRESAAALSPVGIAMARVDITCRSLPNHTSPAARELPAGKRLLLLARKADWLLVGTVDGKTGAAPFGWVQATFLEPPSLVIVSAGSAYEEPSRARQVGTVERGEERRGYARVQGAGGVYLLIERERGLAWIPESLAAYAGR